MTVDEQEALSRRYGNEVISFLILRSGNVAVFNSARELCGIVPRGMAPTDIIEVQLAWNPPASPESFEPLNLEELDL